MTAAQKDACVRLASQHGRIEVMYRQPDGSIYIQVLDKVEAVPNAWMFAKPRIIQPDGTIIIHRPLPPPNEIIDESPP